MPFNQSPLRPSMLVFGDPHGDYRAVIEATRRFRPRAVILLGDLCARRPLSRELAPILHLTEVWFIHGNHDTDHRAWWQNISSRLVGTALENRTLHRRAVAVAGRMVAGLGGIVRPTIWDPRSEHDPWRPRRWRRPDPGCAWGLNRLSSIQPADLVALQGLRADLLVTHEAPSAHPDGYELVDRLAKRLGARLIVHGHHHRNLAYWGVCGGSPDVAVYGVDAGSFLAL